MSTGCEDWSIYQRPLPCNVRIVQEVTDDAVFFYTITTNNVLLFNGWCLSYKNDSGGYGECRLWFYDAEVSLWKQLIWMHAQIGANESMKLFFDNPFKLIENSKFWVYSSLPNFWVRVEIIGRLN